MNFKIFLGSHWKSAMIFIILAFSGCSSMGNKIYTVSSVPNPFDEYVLFDQAVKTLRDNYPNMDIEYQNLNLFTIDEIRREAREAMCNKYDDPIPFNVYLVNIEKYPDYWTIFIVYGYNKPSGTSTYTYASKDMVVKLVQR